MQNRDVRLAAMLHAQVLGFDRFFEEDSEGALSLLASLSELFDRYCPEHRGRVVRSVRDSYLVEFPTAWDAVSCSLEIQRAAETQFAERRSKGCGLTIGIHAGDVHFLENDAAGETIVIAAKLQSMARPGTTSMSEEVYRSVSEKLDEPVRFLDELTLEGSTVKLRAYEIDTSTASPPQSGAPPTAPTNVEDFDEIKRFVLDQIKRVGRRISTDKARAMLQSKSPELDEAIEKLADMGFLSRRSDSVGSQGPYERDYSRGHTYSRADREAWREARHAFRDAIREHRHDYRRHANHHDRFDNLGVEIDEPDFARYRERVIDHAHRAVGGFVGHLIPFLVVNGFLFFLNLSTGFAFPWFLFPLGGWAIGLISHFVSVGTRRREKAEVEALPESLAEEDYKLVRRFHHARASLRATLGSTISVGAFLLMVNLITSPGFLWALFPIAGLFIAIATTLSSYASKRGGFRKRLKELFASKGTKRSPGTVSGDTLAEQGVEQDSPVVRQALRIANSIVEQSKKLDPDRAYLGEDLEPLLLNYIGQIRTLSRRGEEVDEIMAAIPRTELKRDLEALQKRFEHATDPSLKREYQKSIDQIERQNRSFSELESQKELLELRITGSVNSLKQMQIDLARMTGISSAKELDSIGRLRERSRELNEYLHDFSEGYEEIGGLPESGELERKRADELLKEFKEREERSSPDNE